MLRDLFSLFPAYAGVILVHDGYGSVYCAFPRIRGGDPTLGAITQGVYNFSPHTRG